LASGGVLLTPFGNGNVFLWLLNTLETIHGSRLRTIFADEGSALVPAMYNYREEWYPDLGHRVYVFHKHRNFQKHVEQVQVAPEVRDPALRFFDHICSCKTESEFSEAWINCSFCSRA
jgi:hypothetical protein